MRGRRDITGRHRPMARLLRVTTDRRPGTARRLMATMGHPMLVTRRDHLAQLVQLVSLRLRFQSTTSRRVLNRAMCGRRVTGVTLVADITGCQAPGSCPPLSAWSGPQATGGIRANGTFGMLDIGDRTSATTAGSTMASVIPDPAMKAAIGTTESSSTTPPLHE